MSKKTKNQFIDLDRIESKEYEPSQEVQHEFNEASQLGLAGRQKLIEKLSEHNLAASSVLSSSDVEAVLENADIDGESVGDESLSPDQNIVEQVGKAVGLTYQDNEPMHMSEKIKARDQNRWELDPASSEDFAERIKNEGEYEKK